MARAATGELRPLASGGHEARIRIEGKLRKGFTLTGIAGEAAARERCTSMAQIATRLRAAGHADKTEKLLESAAKARAGRPWEAVLSAVDLLCGGRTTEKGPDPITVTELGEDWRSGKLAARFRDHVNAKKERSIERDEGIARLYVDPAIGPLPVADVTLEDCEALMQGLPEKLASSSRRCIAVYVRRLLQLAVYPLRLRPANPIPKGWLPRVHDSKALECLYPDEDRALLACTDVPLVRRLFFGVDTREGMRTDELGRLTWGDVDLVRGRIALDENKTEDPRDWDLDPSVWRALKRWKDRYHPAAEPADRVFVEEGVPLSVNRLPYHLRRDLKAAGVTRSKLFETTAHRRPIRAHDLRATFVTIALATGKTETWVKDRTGHRSSGMLERYRRKARGWNMGPLDALDEAIPELRPLPQECPTDDGDGPISGHLVRENVDETAIPLKNTGTGSSLRIACNKAPSTSDDVHDPSVTQADPRSRSSQSNRVPHAHGAIPGAIDPVEAALAAGIESIASSMASASPAAVVTLAERMSTLARELEARRLARAENVVSLEARRRKR